MQSSVFKKFRFLVNVSFFVDNPVCKIFLIILVFQNMLIAKGAQFSPNKSLYPCNPKSYPFVISSYERSQIKQSQFKISKVYNIRFQRYRDCGKNLVPLIKYWKHSQNFIKIQYNISQIHKYSVPLVLITMMI